MRVLLAAAVAAAAVAVAAAAVVATAAEGGASKQEDGGSIVDMDILGNHPMLVGAFLAVLSAVCNGTFAALSKLERVQADGTDPFIFNAYACLGISLSSTLFLAFAPAQCFTWWGALSGALFVLSAAQAFIAVRRIDLSVAQGVWCGTAIVVSFVFGAFLNPNGHYITHIWRALVAIGILITGTAGVAAAGTLAHDSADAGYLYSSLAPSYDEMNRERLTGFLCAIVAGFFGGLVLAPMSYAPPVCQGVQYLPSFGVGVLIVAPIITAVPFMWRKEWPEYHADAAALPGITSGFVWNLGNACSILALHRVGLAIAYPIMQSGLFVAGAWGIFLYHELRGKAAMVFWVSGVVLIMGTALLVSSR